MKNFIKKYNIESYFEKIPEVNKKVLLESNWEEEVWKITKKHHLLLEETESVVQQIGLVLLGVKPSGEMHRNLTDKAGLLDSEANEITREVNAMILVPMLEKIKDLLKHPHRDDLLSEIEDKQSEKPKETVAHKKLSEIFSLAPATSDHSTELPKTYAVGEDPYHEPID